MEQTQSQINGLEERIKKIILESPAIRELLEVRK